MASNLMVDSVSEPGEERAAAHGAEHDSNRQESREPVKLRLQRPPSISGFKRGLQEVEGAVGTPSQTHPNKILKHGGHAEPATSSTNTAIVRVVHPSAAAKEDELYTEKRREWSREAGLRVTPEIMPTLKPKHPSEIRQEGKQRWVCEQMSNIKEDIAKAVRAYFAEHGIQEDLDSKFIQEPEERLLQLYQRLFGKDRLRAVKQIRAEGHVLRQYGILTGLFGAAVHQWVFLADLPWDLGKDLETALGPNLQYVRAVLRDMGHDYDVFVSNVIGRQVNSDEFRNVVVASYARQRVEETAEALSDHRPAFKPRPKKSTTKGAPLQTTTSEGWKLFLQSAFETAIGVKQVLRSSLRDTFVVSFGKPLRKYDLKRHRLLHKFPGTEMVLHTVISGVERVREGERVNFSKEVVVAIAPIPKTAKSASEGVVQEAQADRGP
ncbi:hypothetical protein HII31_04224 [Pseudocercospora fuligena]|uniref:Uncharacterized protein n=1 Tax=Pseudocercospora fuligena TaxID=685502 RepID=A0A8H6RNS4_9PEZI|nr:hypothetical protein HII31_04224 [Pseudocercospora fuligena]